MSAAPAMSIGDEPMRDTTFKDEVAKASLQPSVEGLGENPEGKSSTTKVAVPSSSEV